MERNDSGSGFSVVDGAALVMGSAIASIHTLRVAGSRQSLPAWPCRGPAPGASAEAKSYADKYRAKYNLDADVYSSWAYDAMHILADAINKAKSTEPEAIRKAILATCGYKGVEGTYCFDENGDGLRGYNIVRNENGKIVFIKHIDNPGK